MTNLTASSLRTSPELRDLAISTLENMQREADEEVRLLEYESLKGSPEDALRDAYLDARCVRWALLSARGQSR